MPALRKTDINQFLARRQENWTRLEHLLQRAERDGLRSLPAPEVREFGILYRRASSDLVTARAKTANAEVLQYLNDLVARAYAQVYRSRRFRLRDVGTFFALDFPRLVRHAWKYVALATAVFMGAALFGWEMNRRDPSGAYYMLPPEMVKSFPALRQRWSQDGTQSSPVVEGASPSPASTAPRTGHNWGPVEMSLMASYITTHNIGIGFWSFAGGIFFGLGPLYAMVQNGLMLGILGEAMSGPQTALVFWSMILPHGIIELSAIFIFGGAGFLIASALLAPGRRSRRDALIERGRLAVLLALGGAAMLVVSGVIEGFITPPAFIPPWAKLAFAATTLVAEVFYFGFAGRGPQPGLLKELLAYDESQERLPEL